MLPIMQVFPKCNPMLDQVMCNYECWVKASVPVPEPEK